MRRAVRGTAIALFAVLIVSALLDAVFSLPSYGESRGTYEQRRNENAGAARHVTNLDAFVNFDYRALDTLGEEFLLFTSVGGLSLLLRDFRGRKRETPMPPAPGRVIVAASELVRFVAPFVAGAGAVFGCDVVMHGALTPGGGFQGGAAVASALIMIWLAYGYRAWNRLTRQELVEPVESFGAVSYALTGLAGIVAGASFLQNVAPLGGTGAVISGGTIWIVNACVGVEVSAAVLTVLVEFAHDTRREEIGR